MDLPQQMSRRAMIEMTAAGGMALHMPGLTVMAADRVDGMQKKQQRSMIVLFGEGGPAGQDSFDPKTESPRVDSLFGSIQTAVPGVHFSELWQDTASVADRMTLFRAHNAPQYQLHASAVPDALQHSGGIGRLGKFGRFFRNPEGASHQFIDLAGGDQSIVFMNTPNAVEASAGVDLKSKVFLYGRGMEATWNPGLGAYEGPTIGTPDERLGTRLDLLRTLEDHHPAADGPAAEAWERHQDRALQLLGQAKSVAMELADKDVRRYSKGKPVPEAVILLYARELIRQGITNLVFARTGGIGATKFQTYGWDHHYDAQDLAEQNIPVHDHAFAELIRDTHPKTGVIPHTTLVMMSDMGRTPKIKWEDGGRDHHPWRTSVVVSDRLQPGVIGKTDDDIVGADGVITNEKFAEVLRKTME